MNIVHYESVATVTEHTIDSSKVGPLFHKKIEINQRNKESIDEMIGRTTLSKGRRR